MPRERLSPWARCRCGSTAPSRRLMPSRHWVRLSGTLPIGWRHHLLIAGPEPHRSWALASQARGVDLLVYRRVGLTAQKTDPIPKPARLLKIHGRGCGLHSLSKILQLGAHGERTRGPPEGLRRRSLVYVLGSALAESPSKALSHPPPAMRGSGPGAPSRLGGSVVFLAQGAWRLRARSSGQAPYPSQPT